MEKNLDFALDSIKEISIKTAWPQVEILYDNAENIRIIIAGDDKSVAQMKVEETGNILLIEQPQYGVIKNYNDGSWMQVFVKVPQKCTANLSVNTITGSSITRGFRGDKISIEGITGNIMVSDIEAEKIKLQTVNGSISLRDSKSEILKCKTVAGKMVLENISAQNISLAGINSNQSVECTEQFKKLEATGIAGNLEIIQPSKTIKTNLKAIAGQIFFDNVKEDENGPEINANLVSGSIKIKRNYIEKGDN